MFGHGSSPSAGGPKGNPWPVGSSRAMYNVPAWELPLYTTAPDQAQMAGWNAVSSVAYNGRHSGDASKMGVGLGSRL